MNPQCARCGKIVYPTEKVSCLDKVSALSRVERTTRGVSPACVGCSHRASGCLHSTLDDSGCEVVGGAGGCEERQKNLFWIMNLHKTTSYLQKKTNHSAQVDQIPVGSLID